MAQNKLFHGYNCYSAAVGEYCRRRNLPMVTEIIMTQWSFFFDRQMLKADQWYTGAWEGPVDTLLEEDLQRFASIRIEESSSTALAAEKESHAILQTGDQQIILVDFYYLDSVRWEHLHRFGIERQHNPHFILLADVDEDVFTILDPYYNYVGQMRSQVLQEARGAMTRQGEVAYRHYTVQVGETQMVEQREILCYRFHRYLQEKHYDAIAKLGGEIESWMDTFTEKQICGLALDAYNCLQSTVDQHRNLRDWFCLQNPSLSQTLLELENEWALVRKMFFSTFVSSKVRQVDLKVIAQNLQRLAGLEESFARQVFQTW